jgi:uncharacterized RDD family membrane protein YckC
VAETSTHRLQLSTPEHVALPFEVAPIGSRVGAFLIDALVLFAALTVTVLVVSTASSAERDGFLTAFGLLATFLARNFYFTFSELRMQGRTIGKRWAKIRVIARDGGPLSAEMVFARNLTRDVEVFLPLTVLFAPQLVFGEAEGWGRALSAVWIVILAALPFFNKHRARVGDLVAGTVVVVAPRGELLEDLATTSAAARASAAAYSFSQEQLDVYGIRELQVLEDVLRHPNPEPAVLDEICEKIKRKIRWPRRDWTVRSEPFLRDFYAAQRARLEHKMLLGRRQERKVG